MGSVSPPLAVVRLKGPSVVVHSPGWREQTHATTSLGKSERGRRSIIGATLKSWHFRAMHVVVEGVGKEGKVSGGGERVLNNDTEHSWP